ncbi:hypothetical protein D9619_011243 [Psilocybe cf. subviscida]|uniref:Uncharacterized protein n=1 Tax=Psilocybe cf. subviscida TaxID=2480587 RepID=A0A8H5BJ39_9AGAR|nr:hypothetical protein D9619_011243 [Psilocybe cf. subviscida]
MPQLLAGVSSCFSPSAHLPLLLTSPFQRTCLLPPPTAPAPPAAPTATIARAATPASAVTSSVAVLLSHASSSDAYGPIL